MNNKKQSNTLLIIVGAVILGIFISISMINLSGMDEYELSTDYIKGLDYADGKLYITTINNIESVCVKETKSEPKLNSLCWIDLENSKASISIYEYRTYHIWTKDVNGTITYYNKYNVKENE